MRTRSGVCLLTAAVLLGSCSTGAAPGASATTAASTPTASPATTGVAKVRAIAAAAADTPTNVRVFHAVTSAYGETLDCVVDHARGIVQVRRRHAKGVETVRQVGSDVYFTDGEAGSGWYHLDADRLAPTGLLRTRLDLPRSLDLLAGAFEATETQPGRWEGTISVPNLIAATEDPSRKALFEAMSKAGLSGLKYYLTVDERDRPVEFEFHLRADVTPTLTSAVYELTFQKYGEVVAVTKPGGRIREAPTALYTA
jgi:hypothetical protein